MLLRIVGVVSLLHMLPSLADCEGGLQRAKSVLQQRSNGQSPADGATGRVLQRSDGPCPESSTVTNHLNRPSALPSTSDAARSKPRSQPNLNPAGGFPQAILIFHPCLQRMSRPLPASVARHHLSPSRARSRDRSPIGRTRMVCTLRAKCTYVPVMRLVVHNRICFCLGGVPSLSLLHVHCPLFTVCTGAACLSCLLTFVGVDVLSRRLMHPQRVLRRSHPGLS